MPALDGGCRVNLGSSGGFQDDLVMPQNFIAVDREQAFLLAPDVRDWLPEGHLAWFVLDAVAEMDLSAFYAAYRRDGWGRPAYDPAMMVALLLYAYCARGALLARRSSARCGEDVAYRVITANQVPDHATIARFRRDHEDAIADLFTRGLGAVREGRAGQRGGDRGRWHQAARQRFGSREPRPTSRSRGSCSSRPRSRSCAEDERFGEARGDELPPELRVSGDRRKRLAAARRLLDDEREAETEQVPRERIARLKQAERRLREEWELDAACQRRV